MMWRIPCEIALCAVHGQWSDELTPDVENGDTLMCHITQCILAIVAIICCGAETAVGQLPVERAWDELPRYQYGQDMAGLLAIEQRDRGDGNTSAPCGDCRALAKLLRQPGTTPAAQQFICLQLRQIGTPAEIPLLSQLLQSSDTYQMALIQSPLFPARNRSTRCAARWINSRAMCWQG